jgi:hypothetical protein
VNPIDFENSEGNVGLANALLGHLAAKLPETAIVAAPGGDDYDDDYGDLAEDELLKQLSERLS